MKVVDRLLERRPHEIMAVNEMQLNFIFMKGTINAMCIEKSLEGEYCVLSFVNL